MKFLLTAAMAVFLFCPPVLKAADLIADFTGAHERFSVFAYGEPVKLRLSLKGEGFSGSDTLQWRLCDYSNRQLESGSLPVTAEELKKGIDFQLKNQKAGCFFLYMKLEKSGITIPWKGSRLPGYVTFGVLPELKALPLKYSDDSRFGGQGTNFIKTGEFMKGDCYAPFYTTVGMKWTYNGRSLLHLEKTPGAFKPKTLEEYKKGYPGWGFANRMSLVTDLHGPPTHLLKFPPYMEKNAIEKLAPTQAQAYPLKNSGAYTELTGRVAKDVSAWRRAFASEWMRRNYYQLHWEPDWHWNGSEDEFLEYYRAAKAGISANDPGAFLMGANYGVISRGNKKLERLFAKGLGKYVDGIFSHLYFLPVTMEPEDAGLHTDCRRLRQLVDRYIGPDAPLINTEWGTDYHRDTRNLTHDLLMNHLYRFVRGHLIALGEGFNGTWFFYTTDYCDYTSKGGEQGYGISFNTSSYIAKYKFGAASLEPKPTMMAAAAMTRLLEGTKSLGRLDHLDPSVFAYSFRRGATNLVAVWSPKKEQTLLLETGVPQVTVYDIMGNPRTVKTDHGKLSLKIDRYPQYVAGIADAYLPTADRSKNSIFLGKRLELAPGNAVKRLLKNGSSAEKLVLRTRKGDLVLTESVPADLPAGCFEVFVEGKNGRKESMLLDISGQVRFGGRKEFVSSSGIPYLEQSVRNLSSIPQSLTIRASYGGREFFSEARSVEGEKTTVFRIPLDRAGYDGLKLQNYVLTISNTNGLQAKSEWFGATVVPSKKVPAKIDGNLADWPGKGFSRWLGREALTHKKELWRGTKDFSCRWQIAADRRNLCLAVEVRDDTVFREGNPKQPWRDDSLILVLGRDSDGNGEWLLHRRFSITRGRDGKTQIQEIFGTPPRGVLPVSKQVMEAVVKRNDKARTTVYEIRIPFGGEAGLLPEQGPFGLGFTVHDIDKKEEMLQDQHREFSVLGGVPLFMGHTRFATILVRP